MERKGWSIPLHSSIHPSFHPMARRPVVEPWPPIIPAFKFFYFLWSAFSYNTGEVWQPLFLTPFSHLNLGLPTGQLPVNSAFRAVFGCTVKRESLYMSSPL
jgi:hypothetical protein